MTTFASRLKKSEFEGRIFVSLSIVATVTVPSLVLFPKVPAMIVVAGVFVGMDPGTALKAGFVFVAAILAWCTLLRMWAGSILTPKRVMAFKIQVDALDTRGPYRLVRNPIYLADFIAMCSFALSLPATGLVMPVLFRELVHVAPGRRAFRSRQQRPAASLSEPWRSSPSSSAQPNAFREPLLT